MPSDLLTSLILWVIKIKAYYPFAHILRQDHVARAQNTDHTARTSVQGLLILCKNNMIL